MRRVKEFVGIFNLSQDPIKIPAEIFVEIDKMILKSYANTKG